MNIVPEGEEREQFWATLRRELPNSFRFCGSKGYTALRFQQRQAVLTFSQTRSRRAKEPGRTLYPPDQVDEV
jgi:multisite-specific tRNA:(cytosine-C5)-methyltransferase